MHDPDNPEIARALKNKREEQANAEYARKYPEVSRMFCRQEKMVGVQWTEREYQITRQYSPENSPAANQFGLQHAPIQKFLVKTPDHLRDKNEQSDIRQMGTSPERFQFRRYEKGKHNDGNGHNL